MSINDVIRSSQDELRTRFTAVLENGGISKEQYVRFLSMQYHLTRGVQKHFMAIAASSEIGKNRKRLRTWLLNFAQEEEFHFQIALNDLKNLGASLADCPLDIKLWWSYFDKVVHERPLVRLGATCVLENIADGSSDVIAKLIQGSSFLKPENLKFLIIHQHGPNLAHGDQILEALSEADLNDSEWKDVLEGAQTASVFYLRFVHWVITGKELR